MGGRVADALRGVGVTTAAGLRALPEQQLLQLLGPKPAAVAQLLQWARGEDSREVVDKGPPKSIQVIWVCVAHALRGTCVVVNCCACHERVRMCM